jgi:hypothetical protein
MAHDGSTPNDGSEGAKTDHRSTYDGFKTAAIWGVALVAIVLILMAIFLA